MATVNCGRGHIYDSSIYTKCPYCENGGTVIDFEQQFSGGKGTVAPQGLGGGGGQKESGGTVAPGGGNNPEDRKKTIGLFGEKELVVGWLVCIKGPEKGKDYRLYAKNNKIGRDSSQDVYIKMDDKISRDQAKLDYDARHNAFQLLSSNNSNTMYVNDNPVYMPVGLSAYDCIDMGNSKFMFIPFCSDKFTWQDVQEESSQGSAMPGYCPNCASKTEPWQCYCARCGKKL